MEQFLLDVLANVWALASSWFSSPLTSNGKPEMSLPRRNCEFLPGLETCDSRNHGDWPLLGSEC